MHTSFLSILTLATSPSSNYLCVEVRSRRACGACARDAILLDSADHWSPFNMVQMEELAQVELSRQETYRSLP